MHALITRSLADVRLTPRIQNREPFLVAGFIAEIASASTLDANALGVRLTVRRSRTVWQSRLTANGTPITLTGQEQGNLVTLTVHNGVPPIPPEVLPYVFEPLARGRAEGASHSIGLGLFIARAIVSAHGGHIHVSSTTDTGTTFTIALPKAE